MEILIREYTEKDYARCEELVNQAWDFDSTFQPEALSAVARKIYTQGSVDESTYLSVAEMDGKVVGFIFGMNERLYKRKLHLGLRLSVLWGMLKIRRSIPEKKDLVRAMAEHEKNRLELVSNRRSEIVLFVIDDASQRKGIGKRLWAEFLENCVSSGVKNIVVETNMKGASSFYETIGFEHLGNFDSPLHEYTTPGGQACMYEYKCR